MNNPNPAFSVTVLADSISPSGVRITTFGLKFPRFLLPEFNTHRVFSRNAGSSRAVPIKFINKIIRQDTAVPVHWGKNQSGMQANEELSGIRLAITKGLWNAAAHITTRLSDFMSFVGIHKQVANRITEPFSNINVIVTSTEWDNWYELRNHPDAQPEIRNLANKMSVEHSASKPFLLQPDEWHIPFFTPVRNSDGKVEYFLTETYKPGEKSEPTPVEDALMISASLCAQTSYRKGDASIDKARMVYDRLIKSEPRHSSPFEHQARAWDEYAVAPTMTDEWPNGITHMDKNLNLWSANFRHFIQHRQILK